MAFQRITRWARTCGNRRTSLFHLGTSLTVPAGVEFATRTIGVEFDPEDGRIALFPDTPGANAYILAANGKRGYAIRCHKALLFAGAKKGHYTYEPDPEREGYILTPIPDKTA